jgi:hypothetical protein
VQNSSKCSGRNIVRERIVLVRRARFITWNDVFRPEHISTCLSKQLECSGRNIVREGISRRRSGYFLTICVASLRTYFEMLSKHRECSGRNICRLPRHTENIYHFMPRGWPISTRAASLWLAKWIFIPLFAFLVLLFRIIVGGIGSWE